MDSASTSSASTTRLTRLASGGGCGCKIAPGVLRDILARVGGGLSPAPAELLIDSRHADDAAAWKLSADCALLATADFFPPVADIPEDFGKIAATNALSDIYAMGGTPLFALALVAMPAAVSEEDVAAILRGGAAACAAAGAPVAGGHSIAGAEPMYGLAVVGRVHPERLTANSGARADDVLILGKPLGIGVLAAALQREKLTAEGYAEMLFHATMLNKAGPDLAALPGARAMTDVTGFGLLGHLLEMCRASGVSAEIDFAALPLIQSAVILAREGTAAGASARNWRSCAEEAVLPAEISDWQKTILTDPQTSGGLLFSCAADSADAALKTFHNHGCQNAAVIGKTKPPEGGKVVAEVKI